MSAGEQRGRKPRADVQRNRAALLETAQRHFLRHGIGTSLEAVAKEAGVGPATLYRHFPTREALLAAVLQTRSEELVARRTGIEQLGDPAEALDQWLRAMEEYFSAYSGLPEPLMAAARAQEPDSPLTIPCDILITATDQYVRAAQRAGHVRASVRGRDLFLAACSVAWIKGTGTEEESLDRLRTLIASGYRQRDPQA
ncbi:TetR/AcrR family transcriptional regulator [Streptomyces stelliscabiei]|uniref:TetR/AcrR family transcriptional regulator n=1 Tax=Streptomyces stelliscabiei TaxID=146820 RepID=UPI0029B24D35|nr:helix-turn-helix domain-containing protein [Streptomyces stelliscabiei]MDX2554200.1 helix-turn-helix domain containing protein [Streptomyces stelliscabiei]MDX2609877.1 helix-turn-helix domain containing protein [Streptomyces stelliscabiei]MDX2638766.1 helix-turn-helix domain containing protein [Streptomyces stelliscabiei]MDX2661919.1 helix-turn-helix domain containing protein [Streptomyces stelliscabiei]MDX2712395.1 helix-turn-helix domain containing protein [Streptomyces stelliscabiei]